MLAQLGRQNAQLEGEVAVRRQAEQALHRAHDELEGVVAQRTAELARANESLRLSEERYARAMGASDAGYWDWNVLTGEMFQSARMKELLGFAPEARFADRDDFVARVPYHPDDRKRVFEAVAATIDGVTDGYDIDYRVILPSGATRWVRARGKVYRDEQGRALRVAGSLSDNTDRKLAEEALRRSGERFALAVAGSTDGIWDWDLLTDEMFFSERAQRLYGLEPGPTVRRRAEWRTAVALHPDDAEAQRGAVEGYLAGRAPAYDGEWRVRHPDGTYRWVRIRGLCVRDDAGRAIRIAGSVSDIDKQKSAEDALRLSEQRYERAMLAGEAGFWEWTAATDHFYASPRLLEMGGFPAGTTFAGRSDSLSRTPYHPEDLARWNEATAAAFAGKRDRVEMEMRVLRSGETRWIHLDGLCTRDATGGVARWTGSAIDITERKQAEDALRLSEERYARAMEGSDAGHWDWNILTDEMFVSERARQMLALPAGPLPEGRSEIMERVPMHPDDRASMVAQVNAGIRSGIYERDYRVIPRPGEVRWLRSRGKVYHDAHGAAVRMTGSLTDVTERKLAADALRASEERYSLAMEASEEGYVYVDVDTGEFVTSERLNEIFGIAPGTRFRGRRDFLSKFRFYGNDGEIYRQAIRAIEADGGSDRYQFEFRIVLPSGEVRWIWTRGKVMGDTERRPRRRVGVFSDITARKLAEEALRASEARFRVLTELSSDWYWEQDENLCFTYLSNQVDDLTGYSGESSLGKTRWEIPNMTPLSCSWAEHQAVLAARQPFRDFECRRVGPDGTVRYLSMSGAPIFDEQRRFSGYQGIGRNITERKRIEEELRARQEMLDLAQKSAQAIAFEWRIRADGLDQNRWSPELAAMYGVRPESYDGSFEQWKKLVHPEDWSAVKEAIKHAQRTGEVSSEYRVVHLDGSVHWLQAKGSMFFDADGKPARMVGFMHDVTERRRAEEEVKRMEGQLRQAQRLEAMGALAGGIAHDFNNILGAILGYGEMALRDVPKDSRLRRDLDSIMTAGERGRALVERILAFSRSGVGERVAVHVERVAREALDQLTARLPADVTIAPRLRAGRAAVLGDPTQIHQVLMNLATNAIQAMPSGGTLRVRLEAVRVDGPRVATTGTVEAGEYLALEVADSGVGIASDVVERIFDPFFTTKEVGVGTGLGLSLVHGIVTELGGAIDVVSTVGKGSVFTVYLPRVGDAADDRVRDEPDVPRGNRQQVLIVDDEASLVRLAAETLAELGYVPVGFTSSAAALEAFRADPERFDAVITDERMPSMSGAALIREIRAVRRAIPILLVSGYLGGAVVQRALESGADEVLKKPLSARELATSLARVLRARHAEVR